MKELIILANLGRIRSVHFKKGGETPQEQNHLVEDEGAAVVEHVETMAEQNTDQSGRFTRSPEPGMPGGMSYGEEHNVERELERKALETVAGKVAEIVAGAGYPEWALAAPQAVLPRLRDALPKACRDVLADCLGADLTKEPLAKLEERFLAKP